LLVRDRADLTQVTLAQNLLSFLATKRQLPGSEGMEAGAVGVVDN
jgi:hypothetical protein